MGVKEHYDGHLGRFYSWMAGDFATKQAEQEAFFREHAIVPLKNKIAVDLGAGHGLQSVSLAQLGFSVKAVDFNKQLLQELHENAKGLDVEIVEADIRDYYKYNFYTAELIVCMGDTLTHLPDGETVKEVFGQCYAMLADGGKLILSYRNMTAELQGTQRFIPVKSDENRIHTCFLECFDTHVSVTDILHEKHNGQWQMAVSTYPKLRLAAAVVEDMLKTAGFSLTFIGTINRMLHIIAQKN